MAELALPGSAQQLGWRMPQTMCVCGALWCTLADTTGVQRPLRKSWAAVRRTWLNAPWRAGQPKAPDKSDCR